LRFQASRCPELCADQKRRRPDMVCGCRGERPLSPIRRRAGHVPEFDKLMTPEDALPAESDISRSTVTTDQSRMHDVAQTSPMHQANEHELSRIMEDEARLHTPSTMEGEVASCTYVAPPILIQPDAKLPAIQPMSDMQQEVHSTAMPRPADKMLVGKPVNDECMEAHWISKTRPDEKLPTVEPVHTETFLEGALEVAVHAIADAADGGLAYAQKFWSQRSEALAWTKNAFSPRIRLQDADATKDEVGPCDGEDNLFRRKLRRVCI